MAKHDKLLDVLHSTAQGLHASEENGVTNE